MDFLDSLFGGLGQLGDRYISLEQVRNGTYQTYQGQAYPEQYQPQPENPQTPASSAAVAASKPFGLSDQTLLMGGGVLLVAVLVLALRK